MRLTKPGVDLTMPGARVLVLSFVIAVRNRLLLRPQNIYAGGAICTALRHTRGAIYSTVTDFARLRG
jgi:hypothetical protein